MTHIGKPLEAGAQQVLGRRGGFGASRRNWPLNSFAAALKTVDVAVWVAASSRAAKAGEEPRGEQP
jgi:hypothetical protein